MRLTSTTLLPGEQAGRALEIMRSSRYGGNAAVIGRVADAQEDKAAGEVLMRTEIGGIRRLAVLQGEGLPRIC